MSNIRTITRVSWKVTPRSYFLVNGAVKTRTPIDLTIPGANHEQNNYFEIGLLKIELRTVRVEVESDIAPINTMFALWEVLRDWLLKTS